MRFAAARSDSSYIWSARRARYQARRCPYVRGPSTGIPVREHACSQYETPTDPVAWLLPAEAGRDAGDST